MAGIKTGISGQINNNIVTDGLVFYVDPAYKKSYPGSGTEIKSLKNSIDTSTLTNGAFLDSNSGVFEFDGVSEYIDLTNNIALSGDRTVSFWVNFGSTPYGSILEGADGNIHYPFFYTDGSLYFRNGLSDTYTILSYGTVNANEWYHFCITGDGTTATVYKNGSSLGTLGDKNNITINYLNGKVYGMNYDGKNGKLGPVQIYNKVLSPSEVLQNYQAQKERFGF
jgi:hypothetical protein